MPEWKKCNTQHLSGPNNAAAAQGPKILSCVFLAAAAKFCCTLRRLPSVFLHNENKLRGLAGSRASGKQIGTDQPVRCGSRWRLQNQSERVHRGSYLRTQKEKQIRHSAKLITSRSRHQSLRELAGSQSINQSIARLIQIARSAERMAK